VSFRLALASAAALGACAWGDGGHFAELSPHLEAALVAPADRDLGDGWQRLASGYEVRVDALALVLGEIELVDAGTGALSFDPSRPPPGYTLCHNGHCHADDGRLVDYAEIEAELSGGSGSVAVVALPVGELDLVAGVARELSCEPDCGLPLADIRLARGEVTSVAAAGLVRDGRVPARLEGTLSWTLAVAPEADAPLSLTGLLELPADRRHPPQVALTLRLAPTSRLFDDLDWAALAADVEVDGEPVELAGDAAAAVLERLAEAGLEAEISRSN
jgi:hypothetical protein